MEGCRKNLGNYVEPIKGYEVENVVVKDGKITEVSQLKKIKKTETGESKYE